MIQGRGYYIPINGLSTGTSNGAHLIEFRASANIALAVASVQGFYRNGDAGLNATYVIRRASAAAAGNAITLGKSQNGHPTAVATASDTPTSVTISPDVSSIAFGGNGGSSWSWFPSVEEHILILPPSGIAVLTVVVAPTSALTMQGAIHVVEIG